MKRFLELLKNLCMLGLIVCLLVFVVFMFMKINTIPVFKIIILLASMYNFSLYFYEKDEGFVFNRELAVGVVAALFFIVTMIVL